MSFSFHLVHITPPPGALQTGCQNDGAGPVWAAVAHTPWGDIPGKAKGGSCWYSYAGAEHDSDNFSYVTARTFTLVRSKLESKGPPPGALQTGFQNESGKLWSAVAHHPCFGDIPGKAKDNSCWFPYGGQEYCIDDFSWVVIPWDLVKGTEPPKNGVKAGNQKDESGDLWCAVAHTIWGDIPGKAKDNNCWFPYDEKEHLTQNFSWVVAEGWKLEKKESPPQNGLAVGLQNDGAGKLWAAVAHSSEWGDIPGKARDHTCWYSYGGKEYYTDNFSWVVV